MRNIRKNIFKIYKFINFVVEILQITTLALETLAIINFIKQKSLY